MGDHDAESPERLDLFGLFVFGTDNENEAFDVEAAQAIKSSNWAAQVLRNTSIGDLTAEEGTSSDGEGDQAAQDAIDGSKALDFSEIDEFADDETPAPLPQIPPATVLPPPAPSQHFLRSTAAIPAHLQEDDYDDEEDASQATPSAPTAAHMEDSQALPGSAPSDVMHSTQVSLSDVLAAAATPAEAELGGFASLLTADEDEGTKPEEAAVQTGTEQQQLDPEKVDILRQLEESVLAHHPTENILWFSELFPSNEVEDIPSDDEKQIQTRSQQLASRIQAAKEQRLQKLEKGIRTESQSLELAILDGRDDGYDEANIMQQVLDDFELVQLQEQMHSQSDQTHSADGTILDYKELSRRLAKQKRRPKAVCGLAKCRFHTPSQLELPLSDISVKKHSDKHDGKGKEPGLNGKDKKQEGRKEDPNRVPLTGVNLAGTVNTYNWEQDIIWSDPEDDAEEGTRGQNGNMQAKQVQERQMGAIGGFKHGATGEGEQGHGDKQGADRVRASHPSDGTHHSSPMQVDDVVEEAPLAGARYISMPVCLEPLSRPVKPTKKVFPSMLRLQPPKGANTKAAEPAPPLAKEPAAKEDEAEREEEEEKETEDEEETQKKEQDPDGTQEGGERPKDDKEPAAPKETPGTSVSQQQGSGKIQLPPELQRPHLTTLQCPKWMKAITMWLKKPSKPEFGAVDFISPLVALDLNNPQLIFEALPTAPMHKLKRAAALVLPPPSQVRMVAGPPVADNDVAKELARFNISKDHEYSMAHNKRARGSQLCRHSVPALTLLTLPLRPTHEQRLNFHRPRAMWLPPKDAGQVKFKLKKPNKDKEAKEAAPKLELTFKLLSGESVKLTVHDPQHTLSHYWTKARSKLQLEELKEQPRLLDNRLRPMDPSATLTENQLAATSTMVHVLYQEVQVLPSRQHNSLPEQGEQATRPLRPPAAFMKAKDLTATEGHILLLEYTDERPLLLSQVGMGVRLLTHYKKRSSADNALESFVRSINQAHQAEMGKLDPYSKGQWQYGMPNNLNPDDDITYLGHLEPGKHMLSVECQLFKAPAAAHPAAPTDFLLIRHANGLLQLREFTGTITVGQEQPEVRVQAPEALPAADESRFIVAVLRELRKKQRKLQGQAEFPDMKVHKLALALGLQEGSIASLKDRCFCRSEEDDLAHFVLKANATIPEEEKLREMCRPEVVCAAESSRAAITSMQQEGIMPWDADEAGVAYLHKELINIPADRWQLCVEMLPTDPIFAQCAAFLEVKLQLTPWTLTDNFVSSHKEQKPGTYLALTGPGDPSGRDLCFSYVREVRRVQKDANQVAKEVEAKGITGTSADLRRMTTQQAHQALLKLGLKEDDFSNLDRWRCIGLVRELSSAAAQDGRADLAKFARTTRVPPWEQQKRYQTKYQHIFDRHLKALNGANLPLDIPIRHPLVNITNDHAQAGGTPEAGAGKTASRTKASRKENEDERVLMDEVRKLLNEESKDKDEKEEKEPPKPPAPKLEARAGDRRIRRIITLPDGSKREWILSKSEARDKLSVYEQIWGQITGGRRVVAAAPPQPLPAAGSVKYKNRFKEDAPQSGARSRGGSRSFPKSKRPRNSDEAFHDEEHDMLNEFEEDDEYKAAMNAGRRSKYARLNTWDDTMSMGAAPSAGTARPTTSRSRGANPTPSGSLATASDHHGSGTESDGRQDDYELLSPESNPRRSTAKKPRKSGPRGSNTGASSAQPDLEQSHLRAAYQKQLCELLKRVMADVIKKDKEYNLRGGVFKSKVPPHVKDYHLWVPKQEEMYLDKMSKKISMNKYTSLQEFRDDMKQVHINAERYNTPGHGMMAEPSFIAMAEQLVDFCEERLRNMASDFAAVEALVNELWVECGKCKKWRKVSARVHAQVEKTNEWHCAMDFERPGASCDLPPDDLQAG